MVSSTQPEGSRQCFDPKTAINELIRGHELTTQLGILLKETAGDGGREAGTNELVGEVLKSISRALTALDLGNSSEVAQHPATAHVGTACSGECRSQSGAGKRKIRMSGTRRGGYRRRAHPNAISKVTSKTIDDGHTWRKYGQKEIHSSKYPRSYFRCTHKHDQDCQATRRVQKSEEDPSVFVITYMGEHTCRDSVKGLQPSNSASSWIEPYVISFESYPTLIPLNCEEEPNPILSYSFPSSSLKHELIEEDVRSDLSNDGSTLDYLALPEMVEFEASLKTARISHGGSDQGDVTSGVHSTLTSGGLDMDFMADSFDFDDVFSMEPAEEFFKI